MTKILSELCTSKSLLIQCECDNYHYHPDDECQNTSKRKFLLQSDTEADSYWLCTPCVSVCVWNNPPTEWKSQMVP